VINNILKLMAKNRCELLEAIQENIIMATLNDVIVISFPVFTSSLQTFIPVFHVLNVWKPDQERKKGMNSRMLYEEGKSRENRVILYIGKWKSLF
jgi:hypothetical protein